MGAMDQKLSDVPSFLKRGVAVNLDCKVQLPEFEGPLDLLLHLIRNNELDLINLPIAKITQQYLLYLNYMRELNLDLASEYLVMAATLTYLKSQVIVPQDPHSESLGPDPKQALIRRLIELKNYKDIAQHLSARPRLFRDVFLAKNTGADELEAGFEPEVQLSNPFQLMQAYTDLIKRRRGIVHRVTYDDVPITACVETIVDKLQNEERVSFQQLLPTVSRPIHVVSMFLGVLEMAKMQYTHIEQDEIFGPIFVRRRDNVKASDLQGALNLTRSMSWE
jgi:segregation and condensation protein A